MNEMRNRQIKEYSDTVFRTLQILVFYIFISEVVQYLSLKVFNVTNDPLFTEGRWNDNIQYILRHIIYGTGLPLIESTIFSILYKRFPKYYQIWTISLVEIFVVHYSFTHWGFNFLSVFNIFPILLCCPYEKKIRRITIVIAFVMTILYCVYQSIAMPSVYHFFILTVNLATEILSYSICESVNHVFNSLIESNIALNKDAYIDKLTGVLNKNAFLNDKAKIVGRSVAFIDVDNFKRINDTYKHDQGDAILVELAEQLSTLDNSTVYRFGGDEFVVFSHNNGRILYEQFQVITKRLYNNCMDKYKIPVTLSVGITAFNLNSNIDDLLRKSDTLLYEAKKAGKNTIYLDKILIR